MAIIFTMYNLRRAITILGVTVLLEKLKKCKPKLKQENMGLLKIISRRQIVSAGIAA